MCLFEDCGSYVKGRGWKVCGQHSSTLSLQQEIERLRLLTPAGAWRWRKHREARRLFELVSRLDAGADSASTNGRLGAALARVKEAADQIEEIAHVRPPKPKGDVAHCGRDECPKRDRAQRPDVTYCGYCGNLMPGKEPHEPMKSHERPRVAPRASQPAETPDTTTEDRTEQLEKDRAGLVDAYKREVMKKFHNLQSGN